ncbi:hypothetical protein HYW75_04045 [Candidatus Pacearchaeota archaeon]|nr:hypothetical protein [Candidatus Pacearchaeota archaeon]
MESKLERRLTNRNTTNNDKYKLLEPREWIPCFIGACIHLRRWQKYERKHPEVRNSRLNIIEESTLLIYSAYQIATLSMVILGAYYFSNRIF